MSTPTANPDMPNIWINVNGAAVQQSAAQIEQDLLNGVAIYPSAKDAEGKTNAVPTSTVGGDAVNSALGSLGLPSWPNIQGGVRHLVMRAAEVVVGIVLVGAAVKSFSSGGGNDG